MCVIYIILTHINLIIIYIAIYIMYDGSTLCWYALENDYRMAANFRGVLIFVIYVVHSTATKIYIHEN